MSTKKILMWLGGAVVLLVIVSIAGRSAGWIGAEEAVEVSTEKAQRRTIVETVSANGKIQPEVEVKISSDVSGEVVELFVKEGDSVNAGDPLVHIKPDIYQSAAERMEASLNTARANLANARARLEQVRAQFITAEATHKRNQTLWEQKVLSDAEQEASVSTYEVARAEVKAAAESVRAAEFTVSSADAALREARDNLARTKIFAPIAGTIYGLKVERGERVVGTTQMAGTEMMRIADLGRMEVNVEVNENDIVRVTPGDTADIAVDAYLDTKFRGVVTEIANSANITAGMSIDQVTNFAVKIRILPESFSGGASRSRMAAQPFRPGMSAMVDIRTGISKNVVSVPIQAVTARDSLAVAAEREKGSARKGKGVKDEEADRGPGGPQQTGDGSAERKEIMCEYVFAYKDGKAVLMQVKSGVQDNMYIEIVAGLSDSAEVVVAPFSAISKDLKDGNAVTRVDRSRLFTVKEE